MEEELKKEKIKRAILAIEDLLESGIYDYYHSIAGSEEIIKTKDYFWDKYELQELKNNLESYVL